MNKIFLAALALSSSMGVMTVSASSPSDIKDKNSLSNKTTKGVKNTVMDIKEIILFENRPLWFIKNEELEIITIGISFTGKGDRNDPKDKPGLTSLLVSMLDQGAGEFDRLAFNKKLLEKNVSLSIKTTADDVLIVLQVPSKNLKEALELLKIALTEPKFDADTLNLQRQNMIVDLQQSLHTPTSVAKEQFKNYVFGPDHPHVQDTNQKIEYIKKATKSDLEDHLKKTIAQACLNSAACGNADLDKIVIELNQLIQALPKGEKDTKKADGELLNPGTTKHFNMEIPQSIIMMAHPAPSQDDPDYYAAFLLLSAIGSTPFESRLWHEIREKRGLAYSVSLAYFQNDLKYGFMGMFPTEPGKVNQVMDIVKQEWKKVEDHGITQDELDLQKQFVTGRYSLTFNTSTDVVNALLNYQSEGKKPAFVDERNSYFEAVTLEDVNRIAKKLLKPELLTFVTIGKKD